MKTWRIGRTPRRSLRLDRPEIESDGSLRIAALRLDASEKGGDLLVEQFLQPALDLLTEGLLPVLPNDG